MGCLSVNIRDEGQHLNVGVKMVNPPLSVSCSLVCDVNSEFYLYVEPDVIWLTPDMVSEEFDIRSNVRWVIEVSESEEPTTLEMLHNQTLITNETLLVDTSVVIITYLENSTEILNKYYLKN